MARVVKYIFISLLAVFLMSHNSYAANYSINVNRFCYTRSSEYFSRRWGNDGPVGTTLSLDGFNNWYYLYLTGNMYSGCSDPQRGDIIQVNFALSNKTENNSLDAYVWSFADDYNGVNKVWEFIDYDFSMLDSSTASLKLFYSYSGQGSPTVGLDIVPVGSRIGTVFANETIIFNNITMYRPVGATDVSGVEDAVGGSTDAINDLKDSIEQQHSDDVDAVQEQSDAAADAADSSGDAAASAGANFIQSMGIIIDAFENIEPSDCRIQFSATSAGLSTFMGSIGEVNLCSGVPDNILNVARALAALVITPIVLQCAYVLVMTLYKMFNEVQE